MKSSRHSARRLITLTCWRGDAEAEDERAEHLEFQIDLELGMLAAVGTRVNVDCDLACRYDAE